MTTEHLFGYAFALSLPPAEDRKLREWAESTRGATWDETGAHVTLARFTGSLPSERLAPAMHEACADAGPVQARFRLPSRESYWDRPGAEIVMLVGGDADDVAGVLALRQHLLDAVLPLGVSLFEGGPYVPHITLTTGLAVEEARRLESEAGVLDLRFTAHEVVYWCGGETSDRDSTASPPWHVVERLLLA